MNENGIKEIERLLQKKYFTINASKKDKFLQFWLAGIEIRLKSRMWIFTGKVVADKTDFNFENTIFTHA